MASKTWKLGEVAQGGVITVEATDKKIAVIGKEWDFSKGSTKGSDQSGAKEFTRREFDPKDSNTSRGILDFLCELTTSYHADQINEWVKSKVKLADSFW